MPIVTLKQRRKQLKGVFTHPRGRTVGKRPDIDPDTHGRRIRCAMSAQRQ